jgi:addiction module HigA family antidote
MDLHDAAEPDAAPLAPVHPGDVLLHEFLEPMGLTPHMLSLHLRVPANRISAIIHGERSVSADTALRLARYFGTTAGFWLNLQKQFELELAGRKSGARILAEVAPRLTPLHSAAQAR